MSVTPLLSAALEVTRFCTDQGWRFCFIGGVAVQRWGNPRFTADIDVDIAFGALPFEERSVERASHWDLSESGGILDLFGGGPSRTQSVRGSRSRLG